MKHFLPLAFIVLGVLAMAYGLSPAPVVEPILEPSPVSPGEPAPPPIPSEPAPHIEAKEEPEVTVQPLAESCGPNGCPPQRSQRTYQSPPQRRRWLPRIFGR